MLTRTLLFLSLFAMVLTCRAQIVVDSSYGTVTFKLLVDEGYRSLSFRKSLESDSAVSMNYQIFSGTAARPTLANEIPHLRKLLDSASLLTPMQLTSANIGYPLEFEDVLQNQINAFKTSIEWKAHLAKNGKKLDYALMKKVMLAHHVYAPFEELLNEFGFSIEDLSTEKHGFLTKKQLTERGEQPDEIIPIPFMVWLKLSSH